MDAAVERAVACMRERFRDPLTVTDIAHSASLGHFPFSRLFREETGVSPGRFLAAVRIHEAKKLIENTSMSFAEISGEVGYDSLNAFTHSFTAAVGLSPGRFRRLCRAQGGGLPAPDPGPSPRSGSVAGTVRLPPGHGNARVFLGAFATAVVQYPAVAQAVVDVPSDRPSCYLLRDVPEGRWHLLAVAVAAGTGHDPHAVRTGLVGGHGTATTTVTVTADAVTSAAVRLRRPGPVDPPVLLALPELEPPVTVVPHPGCAATTPAAAALERERAGAGRLRLVPAAPVPPGA